jgi:inosose dehydratase
MIGSQAYPWIVYYDQQGKSLSENLGEALSMVRDAGLQLWEPSLSGAPGEAEELAELLQKTGLKSPSAYVGGALHAEDAAERTEAFLKVVDHARGLLGLEIVVCNPDPLSWAEEKLKTDAELGRQRQALQTIGRQLQEWGIQLAFHNHTAEMLGGSAELLHMLQGTEQDGLGFCFDGDWVYRGGGYRMASVKAVLGLFASRVKSLHLRQTVGPVWQETLGEGDVDYAFVADELARVKFQGPIILEIAYTGPAPRTLSMVEAHSISRQRVEALFGTR